MILITGASGFLGEELLKHFEHKKVRVVSRNEGKLVVLKQKFQEIEIMTGDISDEWTAHRAMQDVSEVYHLAAMKSVDIAEDQVFSCINTNIIGTLNLLRESLFVKPNIFLSISTDKAAQVNGVYGATKMLMERLMGEAERLNKDTKYRVVRYGNVLYSTGSVLCKWRDKMMCREAVSITDPDMTRFFWTREEAIRLIFECIEKAKDATPWIPEMRGMRMGDLLEVMMDKYGKVPVTIIGNRGGENLHETMDGKIFSNQVPQFTKEEIKKMI